MGRSACQPDPVGTLILEPLTEPHEGVRLFRVHDGVKTLLARMLMIAAFADIAFQHRAYGLAILARASIENPLVPPKGRFQVKLRGPDRQHALEAALAGRPDALLISDPWGFACAYRWHEALLQEIVADRVKEGSPADVVVALWSQQRGLLRPSRPPWGWVGVWGLWLQ